MYKLINAVCKDGSDKLNKILSEHCAEGWFWIMPIVGRCLYFEYNDNSGIMLRTSLVQEVVQVNGQIRVTTENSTYWFEEVK